MKNKQSVVIYHDWLPAFEALPADDAKHLITAIMNYSMTGEEPTEQSPMFRMAWSFIKPTLDRDNEKYAQKCSKNAENGKKGGRNPDKMPEKEEANANDRNRSQTKKANANEKSERYQTEANANERNRSQTKKADNDNDNDNECDYDSECVNTPCAHARGKHNNVFLTEEEYFIFRRKNKHADEIIDEFSEKLLLDPDRYKGAHIIWLGIFARNYRPPKKSKSELNPPSFDAELALKRSY